MNTQYTAFRDYLENQHGLDYEGHEEAKGDDFINWIDCFDCDDWIKWGDLFAQHLISLPKK